MLGEVIYMASKAYPAKSSSEEVSRGGCRSQPQKELLQYGILFHHQRKLKDALLSSLIYTLNLQFIFGRTITSAFF